MEIAYQALINTMIAGIILHSCRRRFREWKKGEVGLARVGVEVAFILAAALSGFAVFKWLIPGNLPAAIVIWVLGMIVIGNVWARLDERIEKWEAP